MDGYGNYCDGDYTNDGTVGIPDFPILLGSFGATGAPGFTPADHDCDGTVTTVTAPGVADFPTFIGSFAGSPGPSRLSCAGTITCP